MMSACLDGLLVPKLPRLFEDHKPNENLSHVHEQFKEED